jgi:autotransporter-associated beta strand protein
LWGNTNNWVGDPALTFNNQTYLIFNPASVVNLGSAVAIGGARTIRSLTFEANFPSSNTATFDIRTYSAFGSGAVNLTFAAASGNASINVAQSTSGAAQIRLGSASSGTHDQGSIVLSTNLDLAQNNTFFGVTGFQFDGKITGAGTITKTGLGEVRFVRDNSGWSGGLNINEGNVKITANPGAMGTGTWTLGGGATNTSLRVGSSVTYSNAGGIVVAAGAGTRTIANYTNTNAAGNSTLSGAITLDKDAIFDITQVTAGTHDRLSLSGAVGGTGGIVKTGTGILILSASNNYSGTTDIQGGKLFLGSAGRLGSGAVTISNGANIDFATGAGQTNIVANNISGGGQIFQNGASTRTVLTGDVTSTGGMTLNTGTMIIGDGATGSYTGDAVVNTGAVLAFSRSNAYTYNGTISGLGAVTKVGVGAVTLTASNTYSGVTSLFDGALVAGDAAALGTGDITFRVEGGNTGTIRYTTNSAGTDWASRIVNSSGTIRLDTDTNTVTFLDIIDSSNVNGLAKSGTGVLGLAGANAYAGTTTVGAGILGIANATALGRTNEGTTVASGAQLRLSDALGSFTVGDEALTISGTGAPTGGALRNDGGDNTWQGNITLAANATIAAASGSRLTIDPASGNAITAANFNLTLEGAGTNRVLGAVNLGTGGLTKDGTGVAILAASNTFSGGIILGQGTLRLDHVNAAGSGLLTQSTNNSTLQINTTGTVANAMSIFNVQTMQTVTLSGNKTLNNATYTVDPGTTTTESGNLSGGGGITKQGTGTLLVTGNNSFTGAVAVNEGVLELASTVGGAAAQTVSVSVATNAILLLSQSEQIKDAAAVTLSGGTIQRGSGVSEVFGSLTLTTDSFLDFGTGDTGNLTFGTYQNNETPSALLTLNNFLPGNSFTFSSTSFSTNSVGSYFAFGTGYVGSSISSTGSTFTITAIPEPSTYLAAAGLLAVMLWPTRRRLLKDTKAVLGLRVPMRDRLEKDRLSALVIKR